VAVLRAEDAAVRRGPAKSRNPRFPEAVWAVVAPAGSVAALAVADQVEASAAGRPSVAVRPPEVLVASDRLPVSVAAPGWVALAAEVVAALARRAAVPAVPRLVHANLRAVPALRGRKNPEAASLPAPRRAAPDPAGARALAAKEEHVKPAPERLPKAAVASRAGVSPAHARRAADHAVAPVDVRAGGSVQARRAAHAAKAFTPCVVPQARLLSR